MASTPDPLDSITLIDNWVVVPAAWLSLLTILLSLISTLKPWTKLDRAKMKTHHLVDVIIP